MRAACRPPLLRHSSGRVGFYCPGRALVQVLLQVLGPAQVEALVQVLLALPQVQPQVAALVVVAGQ